MAQTENKIYGTEAFEAFCEDLDNSLRAAAGGYLFAMLTDRIIFQRADAAVSDPEALFKKGLEIRVFCEKGEAKWFRAGIGGKWRFRKREDGPETMEDTLCWWDETQYLDIDEKRSAKSMAENGFVWATGAGKYPLPLTGGYKNASLRIRNYLEEEPETGALYPADWRLVKIETGEEN